MKYIDSKTGKINFNDKKGKYKKHAFWWCIDCYKDYTRIKSNPKLIDKFKHNRLQLIF